MNHFVLCFQTRLLDKLGKFQGISFDVDRYFPLIVTPPNCCYVPRREAEEDPSKKQVIPYALFLNEEFIFSYRRGLRGGESRLHEKHSVGIGGHIEADDVTLFSKDFVGYEDAMLREINEEVRIYSDYEESCVGMINDDSTEVGKVHFGIVHVFRLVDKKISNRESSITDADMIPISKALEKIGRYENWSQICLKNIDHFL